MKRDVRESKGWECILIAVVSGDRQGANCSVEWRSRVDLKSYVPGVCCCSCRSRRVLLQRYSGCIDCRARSRQTAIIAATPTQETRRFSQSPSLLRQRPPPSLSPCFWAHMFLLPIGEANYPIGSCNISNCSSFTRGAFLKVTFT